jgi:hypothetical protein
MSDKKLAWITAGIVLLVLALIFIVLQVLATSQSTTNNPQQGAAPSPVPTPTYTTESSPTATVATGVAVRPTVQPTALPTAKPTTPSTNPLCSANVPNKPCVQFASIQDAAVGNSSVGAVVHTSENNGIVLVEDDITNAHTNNGSPDTSLNAIQFQCFNIQQGLWYINSTINVDGSTTIRKSAFREVDITFTDQNKGGTFASCNLTSAGVDKINKAGMWDDGDFVGAWALYDATSFS